MSWRIRLAIRSRDDDLADVACASRRGIEDPEERGVAYQLAVDAATSGGMRTAGDLIDHVESMTESQRRQLLDQTREAVGLQSASDVDAAADFERAQEVARRRRGKRSVPVCAVCGTRPTGAGGMPQAVPPARRWHRPEHEHLAAPAT